MSKKFPQIIKRKCPQISQVGKAFSKRQRRLHRVNSSVVLKAQCTGDTSLQYAHVFGCKDWMEWGEPTFRDVCFRVSGMGWSQERNIPLRSGTNRSEQISRTNSSYLGRANSVTAPSATSVTDASSATAGPPPLLLDPGAASPPPVRACRHLSFACAAELLRPHAHRSLHPCR